MPLQVTNPQNHFGNGRGARIDFEAEKLVRVNGVRRAHFQFETFPELTGKIQDFAFQPFQMFQRDVKEIPRTARGIKHLQFAKLPMESIDEFARLINFPAFAELDGGGADVFPFSAEWFNDCRQNEAFNVFARREVRAQLVPLAFGATSSRLRHPNTALSNFLTRKFWQTTNLF